MIRRVGWGLLIVLLAIPIPVPLAGVHAVQTDTLWPLFLLVLAGLLASLGPIARHCRPMAWLLGWMIVRTILGGLLAVSIFDLTLVLMAAWIGVAAADLPPTADAWLVGVLLAETGVNALVGIGNLGGLYPAWRVWMPGFDGRWYLAAFTWHVDPRLATQPQGFLTHPNYWGMAMALALPLILWAVRDLPRSVWWQVGAVWTGVAALSWSRGTWAALAAVWLVLLPPWGRIALGVGSAGAISYALTGSWWTGGWGGRWPVWAAGWQESWRSHPVIGNGLGTWRVFATDPRGAIVALQHQWAGWFVQAFNEPLQLWFELGLVGVAIGLWLGWVLGAQAMLGWTDPVVRMWALLLLVTGVEMWVSIPFRLGPIVLPTIVAAGRILGRTR